VVFTDRRGARGQLVNALTAALIGALVAAAGLAWRLEPRLATTEATLIGVQRQLDAQGLQINELVRMHLNRRGEP